MKYKVISSVPSIDRNTGQQYVDQYGNLSWNVTANDEQNQTYSFLKRTKQGNPAPKVGDVLEGKVELQTSQKGNTYYKFTAERKWEDRKGSYSDPASYVLSYAKDIVVALIAKQSETKKLTTDNIKEDLDTLATHLMGLYNSLKENKTQEKQTEQPALTASDNEPPLPSDEEIDIDKIPF